MASREIISETEEVVTLTKSEAVEYIGLLAALIANEAFPGRIHGAIPSIKIIEGGVCVKRIHLSVDRE